MDKSELPLLPGEWLGVPLGEWAGAVTFVGDSYFDAVLVNSELEIMRVRFELSPKDFEFVRPLASFRYVAQYEDTPGGQRRRVVSLDNWETHHRMEWSAENA